MTIATPEDVVPGEIGRAKIAFLSAVVLWFAFFAFFRSPDFTKVDGPFRAFRGYYDKELRLHRNNHLIYPANIRAWNEGLRAVAGPPEGPIEYVRRTQLMNALAMAVSLGLFLLLLLSLTRSYPIAILGMIALGFSRAYLLLATNAAEPPVGFLWSMVAICLVAFSRRGPKATWAALVAGIATAAAMASYQSMVFIGPAALLLAAAPNVRVAGPRKGGILRATVYLAGCLLGTIAIYGAAYWHKGVRTPIDMVRTFFRFDGGDEIYGGFSLSKAVNFPLGFLGDMFWAYPDKYAGIRDLLRQQGATPWLVWLGILVLGLCRFAILLARGILRAWGTDLEFRLYLIPTLAGIAVTGFAPLYWSPTYEKLWPQCLASIVVLVCLVVVNLDPSRSTWLRRMSIAAVGLIVVSNLAWLIPEHRKEIVYARQAEELSKLLSRDDLLVCGWHPFNSFYTGAYAENQRMFDFVSLASDRKAAIIDDLRAEIGRTNPKTGKVYFLGLVDEDRKHWKEFLGDRVGVPYDSLDEYRGRLTEVRTIQANGRSVTLYRLDKTSGDTPQRTNRPRRLSVPPAGR